MALTNGAIQFVRENIENIKNYSNYIAEQLEPSRTKLNSDNNYQVFITGTEIGKELDDKLQKLIDIIKNLNETEITNANKICSDFVSLQDVLNSKGGE